jgi:hypothetical protein
VRLKLRIRLGIRHGFQISDWIIPFIVENCNRLGNGTELRPKIGGIPKSEGDLYFGMRFQTGNEISAWPNNLDLYFGLELGLRLGLGNTES